MSATGATTSLTQQQVENGDSAISFGGLENDFFTPNAADADTAHQIFYGYQSDGTTPGTLMGFVVNGLGTTPAFAPRFAAVSNFQVAPGIELDNPDTSINAGNISILTNWNLGAGPPNNNGTINPVFRYQQTIAPFLSLRAVSNVVADASITDGFFQSAVAHNSRGTSAWRGWPNHNLRAGRISVQLIDDERQHYHQC